MFATYLHLSLRYHLYQMITAMQTVNGL